MICKRLKLPFLYIEGSMVYRHKDNENRNKQSDCKKKGTKTFFNHLHEITFDIAKNSFLDYT